MTTFTQVFRLIMTLAMIIIAYWSLQCINLEKIILKNRIEQARLFIMLVGLFLGVGASSAIFSISDLINSIIQFITSK